MRNQPLDRLAREGAAWLELSINREHDPEGHGLLGVRAFDRMHNEIPMGKSTLLDLLFEGDSEQMTFEANEVLNVLALSTLDTGIHIYVLENRLSFGVGQHTGDDQWEVRYDADFADFLRFLAMSAAEVRREAQAWTALSPKARFGALSNPETPAEVLQRVAEVGCDEEVGLVARHLNTNGATLHLLAGHCTPLVRAAVADHPSTPLEALALLADSLGVQPIVKRLLLGQAIARHPRTSTDTLRLLYERHRGLLEQSLALNLALPTELLTELAASDSADVRVKVALNECAPVGVLRTLARDENDRVRMAAGHTLEHLAPFIGELE